MSRKTRDLGITRATVRVWLALLDAPQGLTVPQLIAATRASDRTVRTQLDALITGKIAAEIGIWPRGYMIRQDASQQPMFANLELAAELYGERKRASEVG